MTDELEKSIKSGRNCNRNKKNNDKSKKKLEYEKQL